MELENCFQWLPSKNVLLSLPFGSEIHFKGKVKVTVLNGGLECMGCCLTVQSSVQEEIYSPRGYSLLSLCAVQHGDKLSVDELSQRWANKEDVDCIKKLKQKLASCAIAILERLDSPWTHMLDKCLAYSDSGGQRMSLFGRENSSRMTSTVPEVDEWLNVNFITHNDSSNVRVRLYEPNREWQSAVDNCKLTVQRSEHPRLVLVGGKGVGKSTLTRYLTNKLLQAVGPVVVIDFDPGQAEFTIPGCVSCTKVSEPLLGPNFTHLSMAKSYSIYIGAVNVSDVAKRYSAAMQQLITWVQSDQELSSLPWIVNTMGFSHGLGISFLKSTLKVIQPTTVVEIRSRFVKKNYAVNLRNFLPGLHYDFLQYDAMPESQEAKEMGGKDLWGIPEAYKLRDIVLLSHLGVSFPSSPIEAVTPYTVHWKDVCVQILHCDDISYANICQVLNLGLVSLGFVDLTVTEHQQQQQPIAVIDKSLIVPSIGFGIIRGIDSDQQLFYVTTSLSEEEVKNINCLSLGSIALPNGTLITQGQVKHAPYVGRRKLKGPLHSPWQRHHKPKNENGAKN